MNNVLTKEMIHGFELRTNDTEFVILYLVHQKHLKDFTDEMIDFITKEYPEIVEYLITSLPSRLLKTKEKLYQVGRMRCFQPNPKTLKSFMIKMKGEQKFIDFLIKTEDYHRNAAAHGLPA